MLIYSEYFNTKTKAVPNASPDYYYFGELGFPMYYIASYDQLKAIQSQVFIF